MAGRLDDIVQRFHAVKRFLDLDPPLSPDALPLELRAAILDAIEKQLTIVGIDDRVFPYDRVAVRLLVSDRNERTTLERVFADFDARVRERLRELNCEAPRGLDVRVSFLQKAPANWAAGQRFAVEYRARVNAEADPAPAPKPRVKVTVLKGTATRKSYTCSERTILIGRMAEATDTKGRVRKNHVAFEDRNATVSRAHARLKYDTARAEYRLLDDGSARGTRIIRGDASIVVPRDPRGVRVQSGDEIRFGDAVVRVTFE